MVPLGHSLQHAGMPERPGGGRTRPERAGPDVEIRLHTYDETNRRVQPDRIIREIRKAGGKALIGLVGVQSNQFPFHISGCIAMLPEMPQDMREAQALGISFFAGEAEEGRFDEVLRDAWNGRLAPLYNHMDKLPNLQGEPPPILPRKHIRRTSGSLSSMDLGRGWSVPMLLLHHHQRAGPQEQISFTGRS